MHQNKSERSESTSLPRDLPPPSENLKWIPEDLVRQAIRAAMLERDVISEHAADVADALVETSLDGVDTHGVRLLPTYLQELDGGRANSRPIFKLNGDFPSAAVFDADHSLGIVAATQAMREACRRASEAGVAAIAVANSNHFGAAGYYARMATKRDQIGLVFSNSDVLVSTASGVHPVLGTNPIAMAAPGCGGDVFALDMATSQVAYSKILRMLSERLSIPASWALVDAKSDLGVSSSVVLKPLGGYKGQGLAMMVQILCALLASMPMDRALTHLYDPPFNEPRQISHFMIAIELRAFVDPNVFKSRLSELLDDFRRDGSAEAIVVPGDREQTTRAERLITGIPLGLSEWSALAEKLPATG